MPPSWAGADGAVFNVDPQVLLQDDARLRGLEANLRDLKTRLRRAKYLKRRIRLGNQIRELTARIMAIKLAR
jgi:hypothetical protein